MNTEQRSNGARTEAVTLRRATAQRQHTAGVAGRWSRSAVFSVSPPSLRASVLFCDLRQLRALQS